MRGVPGQRQQLDHEPGLCRGHGRRPPVVLGRQRLERRGRGQHGLPCVPADAAWLLHLFHARRDQSGRRSRLRELIRRSREPGQHGCALWSDALRSGAAQPVLPVQQRGSRGDHRRSRQPGSADGDHVHERAGAAVARRRAGRRHLPVRRDGCGGEPLRRLDRRDRPQRLLLGLDERGSDVEPRAADQRKRCELERVHVGPGRRTRHARGRLVGQQLSPGQRLHAVLVQQPPGGGAIQVVRLRVADQERDRLVAELRPDEVHGPAVALRADLQPGPLLHGLDGRPDDGGLLLALSRPRREHAHRLQRHDEPAPRRARVRGAPGRRAERVGRDDLEAGAEEPRPRSDR